MATRRDYYETLGVPRNATEEQIRRAYRQQALKYHPDRNKDPDAAERFKEITEAYEVLRDKEKRAMYDRYGHVGAEAPFGAGVGGFGGFGFEDTFETFFGAGTTARARRTRAQRGADLRQELTLSFEEAVFGCEKELEVSRHETCGTCRGSGLEPGTDPTTCPRCGGSGELRRVTQTVFGQFVNVTLCDRCQGEGRIITTPCSTCQGHGRVAVTRRLRVTVPAGIDDGAQIRLAGEGEPGGPGGTPGDLYLEIHVQPPKSFSMGEAIGFGWETMKKNFAFFIGVLIVVFVIQAIPQHIANQAQDAPAIGLLFSLIGFVLQLILSMGLIRIALKFVDGQQPEFGDLFGATSYFFSFLIASILYGLMVGVGMIFLIVPGIVLAIIFFMYQYVIVDQGLGPLEALRRSAALTRGVRWDLFLFGLLLFGINLLGALALGIGLFVTVPTTMVALAYVYRQLDRQTAPAPA